MHHHRINRFCASFFLALASLSTYATDLPPPPVAPGAFAPAVIPAPAGSSIDLSFSRGVSLYELTRIVLEDIVRAPFVATPHLLSATAQIPFSARNLTPAAAHALLNRVLLGQGFIVSQVDGVYFIDVAPESAPADPGFTFFSYRPKHRPVAYFSEALPQVFPDSKFSVNQSRETSSAPDIFFVKVPTEQLESLSSFVTQLDTPAPVVQVRALFLEVTIDERQGTAVQLISEVLKSRLKIEIGSPGAGGFVRLGTDTTASVFSSFAGDSRFKTLASPSLVIDHSKQGRIQSGSSVPTLGAVTSRDGAQQQSIEYRDTGVILQVTPSVIGSSISLQVSIEQSDAAATATGVTGSPTLKTTSANSTATIQSGDLLMLGGLIQERESTSNNRFLFFPTSDDSSKSRTELVLLLYAELI